MKQRKKDEGQDRIKIYWMQYSEKIIRVGTITQS